MDTNGNSAQRLAMLLEHRGIFSPLSDFELNRLLRMRLLFSQKVNGSFLGAQCSILHTSSSWRCYYKRILVDRLLSHKSFDNIMGKTKGGISQIDNPV